MLAWTYVYNPFTIGGRSYIPTGFEFEDSSEIDLGKGFAGFLIESPEGRTIVVEKLSGGIIGSTVDQVRADIEKASEETMRLQVEVAAKEIPNVHMVTVEEFWDIYNNAK